MRVIAGRFGGMRLVAPRGRSTRPTSERVRAALFSILGGVGGARVLDLYAGTGALGIEALSRGAAHAVFVEQGGAPLDALRKNLASLGVSGGAEVVARGAERALDEIAGLGPYDLVLADPPYAALASAAKIVRRLVDRGALAPGARVVVEHASRDEAPELGLAGLGTRRYGDTALTIYAVT